MALRKLANEARHACKKDRIRDARKATYRFQILRKQSNRIASLRITPVVQEAAKECSGTTAFQPILPRVCGHLARLGNAWLVG